MTKITKKLSKKREENWKDPWQQPCRAKGTLKLAPQRWLQSRKLHPERFPKRFLVVIVGAHESTRQRVKPSQFFFDKKNEDHIAGEGFCSMTHYNLVHKFIPMPQVLKNRGAKGSSGQGMEEARDDSSMGCEKSQEQKGGYSGSKKERQKQCPLCFIDGLASSQDCGVGATIPEVQRKSCASRRHCERRLWSPRSVY